MMTFSRRRVWAALLACALAIAVSASANAQDLATKKFGFVLMHGKWGAPGGPTYRLEFELNKAGVKIETPEMPWSKGRHYDAGYDDAMKQIDAAVAKLKAAGAERIVVGGHSFGANAAIGYAARRDGVAGVIALAAGHVPEGRTFRRALGDDVAKAKSMVAEGKGDESAAFGDINQGRTANVRATAKVYLSFFDPDGPAVMSRNAAQMKPGVALLWVIGETDPLRRFGSAYAFDRAPANPKSRYVEVPGGHMETPSESVSIVMEWLRNL